MSGEIPTPRTDADIFNPSIRMCSAAVSIEFARRLERKIHRLSKSLDREIAINLERSHELGLMESAARLAREALALYADTENYTTDAEKALSALDAALKS